MTKCKRSEAIDSIFKKRYISIIKRESFGRWLLMNLRLNTGRGFWEEKNKIRYFKSLKIMKITHWQGLTSLRKLQERLIRAIILQLLKKYRRFLMRRSRWRERKQVKVIIINKPSNIRQGKKDNLSLNLKSSVHPTRLHHQTVAYFKTI